MSDPIHTLPVHVSILLTINYYRRRASLISHQLMICPCSQQAPKTLPPAAKQALILTYLRNSNTVWTLKELEKVLPSVASINGMQVKEYIQALSDEGQIRVEKIGSGNWYWSFLSEEKRARDGVISTLSIVMEIATKGIDELKESVQIAGKGREGEDKERVELLRVYEAKTADVEMLKVELEGYKDGDPAEAARKQTEVERLKVKVARWTDNIYCLEEYLKEIAGGNREVLERVRMMYYGDEYVEGEGLREY